MGIEEKKPLTKKLEVKPKDKSHNETGIHLILLKRIEKKNSRGFMNIFLILISVPIMFTSLCLLVDCKK